MNIRRVEYYEVDFSEVEKLIQKFLGDEYFCLAENLDASNGTSVTLHICMEDDTMYFVDLENARDYRPGTLIHGWGVSTILQYYARQGTIPFGLYLIRFSW